MALSALVLCACSFHSEPLLAGQHPNDESFPASSDGDHPERVNDASTSSTGGNDANDSGATGPIAGSGGHVDEPVTASDAAVAADASTHDADAGDASTTISDASAPTPDAAVEDAAIEDAHTDPPPDAEPIDSGSPPPPPCPCTCPDQLVDQSTRPLDSSACTPVTCSLDACFPDDDCRFVQHLTSGYYVCDTPREWTEAQRRCAAIDGASLTSIEDSAEDDFLFDLVDDKTWVGGSDRAEEGVFRWETGEVFWRGGAAIAPGNGGGGGPGGGVGPGQGGGPAKGKYANFVSYEPNDEGVDSDPGDCLLLWPDQDGWADATCTDQHGYICEFPVLLPP